MTDLDRNDLLRCYIAGNVAERVIPGKLFANGFVVSWNPERETNPYAIDSLITTKADIKKQHKPFLQAERYGMKIENVVTLNFKDYERYRRKCLNMQVFWWVKHSKVEGFIYEHFQNLQRRIERPELYRDAVPAHRYAEEREGQADGCYVFDLNWFPFVIEVDSFPMSDEKLEKHGVTREQWERMKKDAYPY